MTQPSDTESARVMLSTKEVATLMGVSVWFVRKLAKENGLPCARVSPRLMLFPREGVRLWLEGQVESTVTQE